MDEKKDLKLPPKQDKLLAGLIQQFPQIQLLISFFSWFRILLFHLFLQRPKFSLVLRKGTSLSIKRELGGKGEREVGREGTRQEKRREVRLLPLILSKSWVLCKILFLSKYLYCQKLEHWHSRHLPTLASLTADLPYLYLQSFIWETSIT